MINIPKGKRWVDPKVKQEYLDWLLTLPGEREPASKKAMAEKLGVHWRTLYNWEGTEEFQEAIRRVKLEWGSRWYPDVLVRLMDIVQNGPPAQSVQASKVLLQHIDVKDVKEVDSPEFEKELQERMKAIARELGYEVMEAE